MWGTDRHNQCIFTWFWSIRLSSFCYRCHRHQQHHSSLFGQYITHQPTTSASGNILQNSSCFSIIPVDLKHFSTSVYLGCDFFASFFFVSHFVSHMAQCQHPPSAPHPAPRPTDSPELCCVANIPSTPKKMLLHAYVAIFLICKWLSIRMTCF